MMQARLWSLTGFGDQVVIDADENIIRTEEKALSNSVLWNLVETKAMVESFSGFCVPAHVDTDTNSIISQLGFLPADMHFPLLQITSGLILEDYLRMHTEMAGHSFLRASDAHYLSDLGCGSSRICVKTPSVKELLMAANHLKARKIIT
jgi:PHP family Zn ribbon phosphoesterase